MDLIYRIADINDIDDLIDLKIKQDIYNCNQDGIVFEYEDIARENIKKILLQELNKTIYFFVAIDKNNDITVACNGVVIHQMVPSTTFLNGRKGYITSVYTEENYRRMGIQNRLMQMILDFLKEIECKKIELDAHNPHAVKLYEKFGFSRYGIKFRLDLK